MLKEPPADIEMLFGKCVEWSLSKFVKILVLSLQMEMLLKYLKDHEDFEKSISNHFNMDKSSQCDMPEPLKQVLLQVYAGAKGPKDAITYLTALRGGSKSKCKMNAVLIAAGYDLMNDHVMFKQQLHVGVPNNDNSKFHSLRAFKQVVDQFVRNVVPQLESHYHPPLKFKPITNIDETVMVKHLFGASWVQQQRFIAKVTYIIY